MVDFFGLLLMFAYSVRHFLCGVATISSHLFYWSFVNSDVGFSISADTVSTVWSQNFNRSDISGYGKNCNPSSFILHLCKNYSSWLPTDSSIYIVNPCYDLILRNVAKKFLCCLYLVFLSFYYWALMLFFLWILCWNLELV